jgi:hypothetical protein
LDPNTVTSDATVVARFTVTVFAINLGSATNCVVVVTAASVVERILAEAVATPVVVKEPALMVQSMDVVDNVSEEQERVTPPTVTLTYS